MGAYWSRLTKEQKREKRLKDFFDPPGVKFRDAEAKRLYKEMAVRLLAAWRCEERLMRL
jgi:hypothetical protein